MAVAESESFAAETIPGYPNDRAIGRLVVVGGFSGGLEVRGPGGTH